MLLDRARTLRVDGPLEQRVVGQADVARRDGWRRERRVGTADNDVERSAASMSRRRLAVLIAQLDPSTEMYAIHLSNIAQPAW